MAGQAILWRRLDKPGHEACRFFWHDSSWHVVGTAVFAHNAHPCRLDYVVVCDAAWQTVSGTVQGWVGDETIAIEVSVDAARRWWLNGAECSTVAGSTDIDLHFSRLRTSCRCAGWSSLSGRRPRYRPPGCAFRVLPWSHSTSVTVAWMR